MIKQYISIQTAIKPPESFHKKDFIHVELSFYKILTAKMNGNLLGGDHENSMKGWDKRND